MHCVVTSQKNLQFSFYSITCCRSSTYCVDAGTVDDECDISHDERDWYEYWRLLFARVSEADIEEFEKKYKGWYMYSTE